MSTARVNKADVNKLKNAATQMKGKSSELSSMLQAIDSLINEFNSKKSEVSGEISKLNTASGKLSKAIAKINKKLEYERRVLKEKKAELAVTPPVIMIKLGPVANPVYVALKALIAQIEMFIAELLSMLGNCNAKKAEIGQKISELNTIVQKLSEASSQLSEFKPIVTKAKDKMFSNSEKASELLIKIEGAVDKYLSVNMPYGGNPSEYQRSVISDVDSGKIQITPDQKDWNKRLGNYGEMKASIIMEDQRYMELTKHPMYLEQPLDHGIDHIFYKDSTYFVADSKTGVGAFLNPHTKTGPQLSDTWIDARLDKAVGKDVADIIREKMMFDPDHFYRLVMKHDINKKTIYGIVDKNGVIVKEGETIDELL